MTAARTLQIDEDDLIRRFLPAARLYFVRHGRGADADDLAHEALLVAMEALRRDKVRDPSRAGGFVLGVCRNLVRDGARRDARAERAFAKLVASPPDVAPSPSVDGYKLWSCVNQLAARARDVVLRTFVDDQGADEIAQAHGVTPGNVRVMRHRALAALIQCMGAGAR